MNKKQQEILNGKIGKTVLISIGINHYSATDEFRNLNKCINDAIEIYNVFEKVTPLNFNKEKSIFMISNEDRISTSKNEIINSIKKICEKVEQDEYEIATHRNQRDPSRRKCLRASPDDCESRHHPALPCPSPGPDRLYDQRIRGGEH